MYYILRSGSWFNEPFVIRSATYTGFVFDNSIVYSSFRLTIRE